MKRAFVIFISGVLFGLRYEDGSNVCGWHADDELLFNGRDDDCRIFSISFGAEREFWVAPKQFNQQSSALNSDSKTALKENNN